MNDASIHPLDSPCELTWQKHIDLSPGADSWPTCVLAQAPGFRSVDLDHYPMTPYQLIIIAITAIP